MAFGAELDLAIPVRPEDHQASTRNRCASPIANYRPSPRSSKLCGYQALIGKYKIYGDGRFHFYRLSIQQVWTVTPLSNCFQRGRHQQGVSADQHQVLDLATLRDNGGEHHLSLNAGRSCQRRVLRLDLLNDAPFGYALRNPNAFRGHRGNQPWNGEGIRTENSANYSTQLSSRNSTGHSSRNSSTGEVGRRFVLPDHLYVLGNFAGCAQASI